MESALRRIVVPFHASTSGAGELTWGQREIWNAMVSQRSWLPIFFTEPLESFTTLDDVVEMLRSRILRFDAMRTRLEFGPDGEPRQVVAAAGAIGLEVFEAGDGDPAALAAEISRRYSATPHDHAEDWPVRPAVVLRHSTPVLLVSVYCHLVLDALARQVRGEGPQPLRLAEWERGAEARRLSAASMAYWEKQLRAIPARRFAPPTDPRTPRWWQAEFRSRALYLALQAIAPGAGAATAPLLAVFALALNRVTGADPVVLQLVVGNRFHSHLADVFAPVNQAGLWVLDVNTASIDDLVKGSRRRSMSVYKHAYYDPRARAGLIARIEAERGEALDLGCLFNDRRIDRTTGATPGAADVKAALGTSTFTWQSRTDHPREPLFVNAEDAADVVELTAWTDTHYLAPDDLEAVLREMEAIAVEAAVRR
ncbi:condensation domain-containing protein [Dactylosporangium sp. NPDC051541]|uniref:condensation domain-containing protein n=1 Tax=Dactylosporangium sp. NPDC051541 TaxID=3363977 RepID=UPI00379AF5BD